MVSYYLLTENIIEMTELETQIWNTVHNWCDAQSNEIPDQNRRYLIDEIKALVLSHASVSMLEEAAKLVGNPGTNISGSCDEACMEWQEKYKRWRNER